MEVLLFMRVVFVRLWILVWCSLLMVVWICCREMLVLSRFFMSFRMRMLWKL